MVGKVILNGGRLAVPPAEGYSIIILRGGGLGGSSSSLRTRLEMYGPRIEAEPCLGRAFSSRSAHV